MATAKNKVEVEIVATDEASPKIDRLEKKIDGLEADEARIVVTAETDRLDKQLADARRKLEGLEGDELTVQMRAVGTLEADLVAANKLFEQLDGQTGTVTLNLAGNAADQIDRVGKSADSSKSVLANMIGNTTQDLGALGGIAGGAGVAIGQIGEYAADAAAGGERLGSVLRSFAGVAGPIAGLTLAVYGLNSVLSAYKQQAEQAAEVEAFNVENVEQFVELAREGLDIVTELVNRSREQQKIEVAPNADQQTEALKLLADEGERLSELIQRMRAEGDAFDFRTSEDGLIDITDLLREAELTARDFFEAASDPRQMSTFIDTVKDSNLTLDEQATLLAAALYQAEQYRLGVQSAADDLAVFGRELGTIAGEFPRFGGVAAENFGIVEQAADDVADSISSVRSEWELLNGTLDKREAIRNAEEALEDVRTAAEEAFIAAATGADDAAAKHRDYEAAVDDLLRKLIVAGEDPVTINTILETFDQGMINEALAIAQAKLDKAPPLSARLSLNTEAINRRIDEFGNVRLTGAPPPQTLSFAPVAPNVTIINPPGTPAATAGQLTIYTSRNGERAQ